MNMTDHLIEKGVKKHFNGQIVLFAVASLNEHFDGLQIHDTDIVKIEQWENDELVGTEDFIKASDVNFDGAVAKEVLVKEYQDEPITETIEMIEPRVVQAGWKENEESYENSEEGTKGIVTKLTPEEADALIKAENSKLEIKVTEDILDDNSELVKEGIEIGEIITVDAQEVKAEPVEEKTVPEEIVEVPKPRFKK